MKRAIILLIVACVILQGCATPGVKATATEDSISITPTDGVSGLWDWLFGRKLPAGEYEAVIEDKKLKFKTKQDLKLIDINAGKIGD